MRKKFDPFELQKKNKLFAKFKNIYQSYSIKHVKQAKTSKIVADDFVISFDFNTKIMHIMINMVYEKNIFIQYNGKIFRNNSKTKTIVNPLFNFDVLNYMINKKFINAPCFAEFIVGSHEKLMSNQTCEGYNNVYRHHHHEFQANNAKLTVDEFVQRQIQQYSRLISRFLEGNKEKYTNEFKEETDKTNTKPVTEDDIRLLNMFGELKELYPNLKKKKVQENWSKYWKDVDVLQLTNQDYANLNNRHPLKKNCKWRQCLEIWMQHLICKKRKQLKFLIENNFSMDL